MMDGTDNAPGREQRVFSKVTYDRGCWLFRGKLDRYGYGVIGHKDGTGLAHRAVYIALIRDPGPDVVLDHLCRNTACVNPWHLRETTAVDNVLSGANKRDRPRCRQGHLYTPQTTAYGKGHKDGRKRICTLCRRRWSSRYKAKIRHARGA